MTNTSQPAPTVIAQCIQSVVVVSASHPTLGALYWSFTDGSDHNAPNCYSVTDRLEDALTLRKGWREGIMAWNYRDHMAKVMADDEQFDQTFDIDESLDGKWEQATQLGGMLKVLQERSGQDVEAFADWLASAVWRDVAISDRPVDFPEAYVIPELKPQAVWTHRAN